MYEATGWIRVMSDLERYSDTASLAEMDALDEIVNKENKILWQSLQKWLTANGDVDFKWQFYPQINNISGVLQLVYSRNTITAFLSKSF